MFSYGWPPNPPDPEDFPCEFCGAIESEEYGKWYADNHEAIFCCCDECLDLYMGSFKRIKSIWLSPLPYYNTEPDPFSHI